MLQTGLSYNLYHSDCDGTLVDNDYNQIQNDQISELSAKAVHYILPGTSVNLNLAVKNKNDYNIYNDIKQITEDNVYEYEVSVGFEWKLL
jgi:hypothetical protein